jgi:pyruvate dehydrogenase E2 component (dihydrolipoamide acetyltransferase)
MNLDFTLPALGENIENGEIVNVLVREGDQIAANQPVLELETDKAVLEIPCPHAGRVTKVHIAKGDTVAVGQTLISVESEAAEATDSSPGATGSLPASGDESPIPGATGSLAPHPACRPINPPQPPPAQSPPARPPDAWPGN